ncbi:hypothetical protein QQF64_024139 [Cirrhinus molitorella]|uniref:Uncharacterized protein n=1 Tax=Cirrhinus molitorella TaxID=172907 RepID=A0ABR3NKD5_9TELE
MEGPPAAPSVCPSAQTCEESRSSSACLGLAPPALPARQNQAQTCLSACLGPGLIGPSDPPSVSWQSAPSPHTSLRRSQLDPQRKHRLTERCLYQRLAIGLSIGPHTGNHSISACHLIPVCLALRKSTRALRHMRTSNTSDLVSRGNHSCVRVIIVMHNSTSCLIRFCSSQLLVCSILKRSSGLVRTRRLAVQLTRVTVMLHNSSSSAFPRITRCITAATLRNKRTPLDGVRTCTVTSLRF